MVIDFDMIVTGGMAGDWTLQLTFGRQIQNFVVSLAVGDDIKFNLTNLNEYYTYSLTLLDPDGNVVMVEVNGVEYDCLEFKTQIGAIPGIIIS
jgi:hypothetical protein